MSKTSLLAKVDPAVKAKVVNVAQALGVSQSAAIEAMLANTTVDANGRPSWHDGPLPSDSNKELPLSETA